MNDNFNQEELSFLDGLRTVATRLEPKKFAQLLIDTQGIYKASDIAHYIREIEKTIPSPDA